MAKAKQITFLQSLAPLASKETVLAFLHKNQKGKAIEIAKLSGLKVTSVNQTLYGLKKADHVKQAKKRGSPFVLVKK